MSQQADSRAEIAGASQVEADNASAFPGRARRSADAPETRDVSEGSARGDSSSANGRGSVADDGRPAPPRRIVAIDGPAGAGKSTVAARLAERFGLLNLETGAMYRAFALKALSRGVALDDGAALEELGRETSITLEPAAKGNRVLLDGTDVTGELRSPEVTQAASQVSVHAGIRAWMVALQRELGAGGNVVMEGRDIGTAVFPDADVKVFLDASPEARSQRRYQQVGGAAAVSEAQTAGETPAAGGAPAAPLVSEPLDSREQAVLAEMRERDQRDRNRAESPLRPAADAVVIDSTQLSLEQVIEQVAALVTARWAGAPHR